MESINIIKGYNKVNPSEDQIQISHHPPKASHRRSHLSHHPINRHYRCNGRCFNPQNHHRTTRESIIIVIVIVITFCQLGRLTQNHLLRDSIPKLMLDLRVIPDRHRGGSTRFEGRPWITTNPTFKTDPEFVFNLSIQVAVKELTNLTSLPKTLLSKSNDPSTESALKDCMSLFDDALSQLNKSVALMDVNPVEWVLTEAKIGDLNTWISSAMSDEETCLDGLEEMGSTMVDEVRTKVQTSKEYMSNSLAILVNIQSLLDKFDLRLH
ncbi:unnamed protein product [Ilex paraguariensis]|uniref:pectinesterase n=1 Tax=Ilex paraguariensis TaxID=185542 RepID=A0ABC8SER8_9AQUA